MILGALSLLRPRPTVPIRDAERATLDFEAARARNHLLGRTLRRARARFMQVLRFGWVFAFAFLFGWSPAGVLAFLAYGAVLTVVVDGIRYGRAQRWVHYSHARNYRADEILAVCIEVEKGNDHRKGPGLRPRPKLTMSIAMLTTFLLLPTVAAILSKLGLVVWNQVLENFLMPFCMIVIGLWRIVGAVRETLSAMSLPVGSQELLLESDDALDIYAGLLLFSWLPLLFNQHGPLLMAICIFAVRLGYRAHQWWWLRESLPYLTTYAKRARASQSSLEAGRAAALAAAYGDDSNPPGT